jgi:hypothetical protein
VKIAKGFEPHLGIKITGGEDGQCWPSSIRPGLHDAGEKIMRGPGFAR